jgi:hypothetical protein
MTLKLFSKIVLIFILAVIQIMVMPRFGILGTFPNLIFILALVLVIYGAETDAFLVAGVGGFILDLASPMFFGFNVLINLSAITLTRFVINKFLTETSVFISILIVGLVSVLLDLFMSLVTHQFSLLGMLTNLFYSMIVGFIFYRILNIQTFRVSGIKVAR